MKIVKNTTGEDIYIEDVGKVKISASSNYTIVANDYGLWCDSSDIDTLIDEGSIVINDGYDDLCKELGKKHIHEESVPRSSAFIAAANVLETFNDTLTVSPSSRLLYIFTGTTSGQIFKLGDAREYTEGHCYEVWNNSSQSIGIRNNSNESLHTLVAQHKTFIKLQDNSTQAGVWLVEANFTGSGSFGTNHTYAEDETTSSTTSESYQQKLRLSLTDLPAGNYRIEWYYEWKFDNGNFEFWHRVQIDDSTILKETNTTPRSVGDWRGNGGFRSNISLSAGNHYIDMDYCTSEVNKTAYIRRARLEIWRIS